MHKPIRGVPGIFRKPDREEAVKQVGQCISRIYANWRPEGLTWEKLAKELECSVEVLTDARDEKSLPTFDTIARIGFLFPEEFACVETLWHCRAAPAPTTDERITRIEAELAAIRRETAA